MPTPGQELSSIDFESMIGGPLVAVINAQAQAAMSTVNFIKEVGFKKPSTEENAGGDTSTEEPIYVGNADLILCQYHRNNSIPSPPAL